MSHSHLDLLTIGTQRIRLHRPPSVDELLEELASRDPNDLELRDERLPYWADIWPSCRALIQAIQERASLFTGREVIELGAGLGLAGIAAGLAGATVTLTDYSHDALRHAAANWALNLEDPAQTRLVDWREPPPDLKGDVLIASDVAYEERFFVPLTRTFQQLLRPGGEVLLTEPCRAIGRGFFPILEEAGYTVRSSRIEVETDGRVTPIDLHHLTR